MNNLLSIGISVTATAIAIGAVAWAAHSNSKLSSISVEVETLAGERETLLREIRQQKEALRLLREQPPAPAPSVEVAQVSSEAATPELEDLEPEVTVGNRGRKSYLFRKLYDPEGRVIARDAQFRELLGLSKLSFKTSEGTRYFGLDDLHPKVLSALGYDADVLKRRITEEHALAQLRGARATLQAQLRTQAAQEAAAREAAAAERSKAEAALREAEAKERLASLAEEMATNPPKPPQVHVRVINVDEN
jgi:hypothetical protein